MRNLIFAINLTLDGCCDHSKGSGYEETYEYFTRLMQDVDLFLYGRITYQLMVPFWPEVAKNNSGQTKAMNEFAHAFDAINKVVVSTSLEGPEENNTRIIRTNLHDEVLKLKQQEGKKILTGGVAIPTQLIEMGLVDEYCFLIQPILVGEGRRLLEGTNLPEKLQLQLVESKVFKSGLMALRYLKNAESI